MLKNHLVSITKSNAKWTDVKLVYSSAKVRINTKTLNELLMNKQIQITNPFKLMGSDQHMVRAIN